MTMSIAQRSRPNSARRASVGGPVASFMLVVGLVTCAGVMALFCASAWATGTGRMTVSTFAGTPSAFDKPNSVCADGAGNLYVADTYSDVIRKISPTGEVSVLAGRVDWAGSNDGSGSGAQFCDPQGICFDSADGNLYVADTVTDTIRRVTTSGVVTTIAGLAWTGGSADGSGTTARFSYPSGICYDPIHNCLYVTDSGNYTIRKVTPVGAVTTPAGSAGASGTADGTGAAARFSNANSICFDALDGYLYVTDGSAIRKMSTATPAAVTTIAGVAGWPGSADGTGAAARFYWPTGVCYDQADGYLYVTDTGNDTVRRVSIAGAVTTLAGSAGVIGSSDGAGATARFRRPTGICYNFADSTMYVTDSYNDTVRSVTSAGLVTTFAGSPATFDEPGSVSSDPAGNVYFADTINGVIRKVTPSGTVSILAGGVGVYGTADGTGSGASFSNPNGIWYDAADGNLYVTDTGAQTIRRVSLAGVVTTIAGSAHSSGTADGTTTAARFTWPEGICYDSSDGYLYVTDTSNCTIRKVSTAGVVTTIAGSAGVAGSADGTGAAALFRWPRGLAFNAADGCLYVTDTGNDTIRKVSTAGTVSTFAGTAAVYGSVDGTGGGAQFAAPRGICYDAADGDLYVTDSANDTIRGVTPGAVVTTVAGSAGSIGSGGGVGGTARFAYPMGVGYNAADGAIYVADSYNDTLRQLTIDYAAPVTTAAGLVGDAHSSWQSSSRVTLSRALDGVSYYSVDGGAAQAYSAPFAVSGTGSHVVLYYSVGPSGVTEAAHLGYVNVDTGKPTTQALAAVKVKKGKAATFRFSVTDLTPSATVTIKIYKGTKLKKTLSAGVKATNSAQSYKWTCSLLKGSYTWKLYATDAAGNAQASVSSKALTVK
jgi:DNA-binding beta-propeller fold protein YncE